MVPKFFSNFSCVWDQLLIPQILKRIVALTFLSGAATLTSVSAPEDKCLFISSYHQGYEWSDGVEKGIRTVLDGKCQLRQFDLDAKRQQSPDAIEKKVEEVREIIKTWQPDVVITADDIAAKHIVKPHYRDHAIPFVFCGVNWTVKEYEFPYSNVTGIIEVAPIAPLLEKAETLSSTHERAFYIGADTLTERKNLERFQQAVSRRGMTLDSRLAATSEAWLAAFEEAQQHDVVVLGSNSGINDWDDDKILSGIRKSGRRLSLTNHGWMMPFTMLGLTKIPEEHGEWAAEVALHILEGVAPSSIPIITNRKWDIWVNPSLLQAAGITLPEQLLQKGKKVF